MNTLLKTKSRPEEEVVRNLPGEVGELVSDASELLPAASPAAPNDLISAAHQVANDLHDAGSFYVRLGVYKRVAREFKSEARRVLNIAAARWPELIPMVNDLPEWKALLSADVS